jgi:spore coat protein U domain-containing protein, fimbrial subunit CupE1/2/3/6
MKFLVTIKSALPAAIVVLALGLRSTSVFAATVTTTFQVSADVQANCTISVTALAFGAYTSTTEATATAFISLQCSSGTNWTIGMDAGLGTGATVANRAMAGPNPTGLNYSLFQDPAHTLNWGNTPGVDTISGTATGGTAGRTVYGHIPAGQFVTPGAYLDTITATITF